MHFQFDSEMKHRSLYAGKERGPLVESKHFIYDDGLFEQFKRNQYEIY